MENAVPEPEVVSVEMARDATSVIISVGDELPDVLGWRPEEFVGHSSTDFVHPEDQLSAIAMWFAMMESPGETHTWQGRYRTSDGEWKWVECVNVSRLEDRDNPVVLTTMKRIAVDQVSVAEELRDRTQLLSRLSDAMPIGMFQMDAKRAITFTNDRLQKILGHSASATVDSQFSIVLDDDRPLLETAFDAVLANESVDDVELRFSRTSEDAPREERVCVLSIRPLTDRSGHVTGAVGCVIDVTAQAELRHQLEIRANTDELTSCPSRARILEVLSGALDDAGDSGTGTAAIFIDLCAFKEINDRLGHAAGDQVLRVAGTRLMSAVRQYDQVGRFGGDEFLIVCPRVESAPTSLEVAKRITAALVQPVKVSENVVDIRASVGVAWSSVTIDADSLIAQADHAMYESKRNGSSSVSLFTETN